MLRKPNKLYTFTIDFDFQYQPRRLVRSMVATMANVLFFIFLLTLLNSSLVLTSSSFVFYSFVASSKRSLMSHNDDYFDCGNYTFGNFSGISSIITRCCCNVLPTCSWNLPGPGPSLFSSASVLLWSRPAGPVPFRPRTASRPNVLVSLLLLMSGDVEINPGPAPPP